MNDTCLTNTSIGSVKNDTQLRYDLADPTTFSPTVLGVRDEILKRCSKIPLPPTQDTLYWIEIKQKPEIQLLMARILKGIVPVSDIITLPNGKSFSWVMPVERISGDRTEIGSANPWIASLLCIWLEDCDHELPRVKQDRTYYNNMELWQLPNHKWDFTSKGYCYDFEHGFSNSWKELISIYRSNEDGIYIGDEFLIQCQYEILEALDCIERRYFLDEAGIKFLETITVSSLWDKWLRNNHKFNPSTFARKLKRRFFLFKWYIKSRIEKLPTTFSLDQITK